MNPKKIKHLIQKGEGTEIEFKTAHHKLNKNAFESICGFLNRQGGHLILGVNDDGQINGVEEDEIEKIIDAVITSANNPQKLDPPFYLSPEVVEVNQKKIICIFVPESSQVHKTAGKIFDRNKDGDFDITSQTEQVTQLYLRKQSTYSENKIFPSLTFNDFNKKLFPKVRKLAKSEKADHPWLSLDNRELFRSAGLFKRDFQTGKAGYTLAAVLLFGKDEVIRDVVPAYKTDAVLRVQNQDKYDDRDVISTNLIESFERLMSFIRKHLPNQFFLEGDQRINLRSRIFYEVVSNLLIHREYINAFPAKLIIERNRVLTENWNRPHGHGKINPDYFSPYPKNPVMSKFFRQIGRAEELGSGIRNMFKYVSYYTPERSPEFFEGDIFKAVIPIPDLQNSKSKSQTSHGKEEVKLGERLGEKLGERLGERLGEKEMKIISAIEKDRKVTIKEMSEMLSTSTTTVENNLNKLKAKGVLERIGPDRGGHWKIIIDDDQ